MLESNIRIKGTYLIAAIHKDDCIVTGADGKTSLTDTPPDGEEIEFASYSANKLIQFQNIIISHAGDNFFDNITLYGIVKSFEEKISDEIIDVDVFFNRLSEYAKTTLTEDAMKIFEKNVFIVCGYKNDIPYVIKYQPSNNIIITLSKTGYVTSNSNTYSEEVANFLEINDWNQTRLYVEMQILNEIQNNPNSVGEYRSIAIITKTEILWHHRAPYQYASSKGLYKDYKDGLIDIQFKTEEYRTDFEEYINKELSS